MGRTAAREGPARTTRGAIWLPAWGVMPTRLPAHAPAGMAVEAKPLRQLCSLTVKRTFDVFSEAPGPIPLDEDSQRMQLSSKIKDW